MIFQVKSQKKSASFQKRLNAFTEGII